jgi:hypothetical protein
MGFLRLMPKGFQSEERITALLWEAGVFQHPDSAVVRDIDTLTPHLILEGPDRADIRELIFRRDRGRCKLKHPGCTKVATEMHHIVGGNYKRCDCPHNLCMACASCHKQEHVQVESGKAGE